MKFGTFYDCCLLLGGLWIPVPKWFGRTHKPLLLNENSTLVACATLTFMT